MKFMNLGKVCALACVLAATAAVADPRPTADWQEYKSAKGGFRVEMPGKPAEDVKDLPSAPNMKLYAMMLSYNGGGLLAFASDLAPMDVAKAEQVLDVSRDTAVKSMGATASNEKREMVGKYPARRFDYSSPNGYRGTMRIVLGDKRLYQINAIGPGDFSSSPEAKRFIESFGILEK
jgi:hypothetical protein